MLNFFRFLLPKHVSIKNGDKCKNSVFFNETQWPVGTRFLMSLWNFRFVVVKFTHTYYYFDDVTDHSDIGGKVYCHQVDKKWDPLFV